MYLCLLVDISDKGKTEKKKSLKKGLWAYLTEVDDTAQEVEKTLEWLEWFEEINQRVGGQLFMILGSYLHANLKHFKINNKCGKIGQKYSFSMWKSWSVIIVSFISFHIK